jgi:hypothetical protein
MSIFHRDSADARSPLMRQCLLAARAELHKMIEPPVGLNPLTEDYAEVLEMITHLERMLGYGG